MRRASCFFTPFTGDMIFPHQVYEKDEVEALVCHSYTLFLLCDGPKQADRANPRFIYREQVRVTTGIGGSPVLR